MIGDVVARLKRMQGANVLHPFGWDAFGLPAENAAIKNNLHPEQWTLDNIAYMKGQLQRLGISYAWGRELATCLPDYYRWNQWLFIRMFERDLAYRRRSTVNWCPSCLTVLANEQVIDGACWRCGTHVTSRELEQWFLRITHYAEELLEGTNRLPDWPEKVLTMQRNWIGKSEGVQATFPIADAEGRATSAGIEIFTTRIDTIYGATFVLIAPEHDAGRDVRERVGRSDGVPQAGRAVPAAGPPGADVGRGGEGRLRHGASRDEPVHGRDRAGVGGQLRARRLRHGRDHGGAGARPARLRVRPQVRPRRPRRGQADRRSGGRPVRRSLGEGGRRDDGRGVHRVRREREFGRVHRPADRGGLAEDGRLGARHAASARRRSSTA